MRRLLLSVLTLPLLLALPLLGGVPAAQADTITRTLTVEVLSNRADLVSGGDALVRVVLPSAVKPSDVRVTITTASGSRSATSYFALRPDGTYTGWVRGLVVGANDLVARATLVRSANTYQYVGRARITNHPNGGPIFSGPQLAPYHCQSGAIDKQCNQPVGYSYLYASTDPLKPGLQPYDPADPPSDVATTTTDQGVTVPFVVRREDGFQDRDRYSILTLFRPGQSWQPWAPQKQWNHKLLVTHGGNCGIAYEPGEPRFDDYSGTIPASAPGVQQSYVAALGKGFAVLSTALNNTGHNCNVAVEAESMMMAKERLVERYGPIRYTIGTGCSGGSIAQHTIANAYPGIYQGLVTTCSYPDTLTAGAQFADYHLLRQYFESSAGLAAGFTPLQWGQVEGHLSHMNAVVADEGLFKAAINPETACPGTTDPVAGDRSTRFDSDINPGGVRCSILDVVLNLTGPRPQSAWSPSEQAAGHGFGGIPFANAGVQYGLEAWRKGQITTAQFVDLNAHVGGLDINADHIDGRIAGDNTAVTRAYRTGLINETDNLDSVAMINHGGPDPGIAHDYSHAWWTQYRLQRAQGNTRNRVMWFGTTPLIGNPSWAVEAMFAMDTWLSRVEADTSTKSLAQKIADDKQPTLTDRCQDVPGIEMTGTPAEPVCQMPELQLHLGTPRQVAGDDIYNDRVSCRLRPLNRADYDFAPIKLTDAQWATLQQTFPRGVCDYSVPGIGQGATKTWLGYGTATSPTYGGSELAAAPASSGQGWFAPAFRELWRQ